MDTKLTPTAFFQADYKRNVWQAYPEPDLAPKDLIAPHFWANVAEKLRPYDRVEALAEDGAWWAEYLVLEAGHNWAKVVLLRAHDLKGKVADASPIHEDYEIKHRGIRKWSVLRKDDNAVLKDGLNAREDAVGWLGEHLKAMAA